ncbi:hypothetical protein [Priestia filamentosa]|uniref:hypothetical protein n=1 Tax=Priestia filamentosa TaxID=1402861 RepID=UPI000A08E891|nr:hypothetical protein [Priestia filamentosa]MDT3765837.1 hypothetical protein [Priestia filamentosa]OXS65280.1 hypothetical protein B1B01_23375 [Priestia filamentosa]SMF70029.1 hypothetical protein SAMN06296056_11170 [Priestia filamentosa]
MNTNWKNRESIFSYLDEYSHNTKEQIDSLKVKNTLLKSYVFETFDENLYNNGKIHREETSINTLFTDTKHSVEQIDEELFILHEHDKPIGFIEQINSRFSTLYTTEPSKFSDRLTLSYVKNSTILDSLWISGKMFDKFLNDITSYHHSQRFTRMKFEFNAMFEQDHLENNGIQEHKVSSVSLVEELGGIVEKLDGVRQYFSSFYSVGSLRFPSNVGRGGHDVYQNGKFTNRSDSFTDHRVQLREVVKVYQEMTERLEKKVWIEANEINNNLNGTSFKASPVTIKFNKPLRCHVFNNFVESTFPKGREPFKIYGEIKRFSEEHVHIYGVDLHLWQNVMLDLSTTEFILFLPKGTCGNTIHRLVTNIQRFLDPEINVYIGDIPYERILDEVIGGQSS